MSEMTLVPSFLLDWKAAEAAAVNHMRTIGFIDAQVTGPGADGGIDALSSEAAAQVKFYANPIGRPDLQRLRGAAHEYRLPLFYSTGGYTKEAVNYATEAGVALFQMDPYGHCEPASVLASLLGEAEHVQERKQHLQDLQAVRYRFAASALEGDLELYAEFARVVSLSSDESPLYSHVTTELALKVHDFRAAVEAKQFEEADIAFGEVLKRTSFLTFITGDIGANHVHLEEAVAQGWQRDATPGSDTLLARVSDGILELTKFHAEALDEWIAGWPENMPGVLIDDETLRLGGTLLIASFDRSLLTPALLKQLEVALWVGVERGHRAAEKAFEQVRTLHASLRLDEPRIVIVNRMREASIASRILRQLEASDN